MNTPKSKCLCFLFNFKYNIDFFVSDSIMNEYLGCYDDQEYERDLNGSKYESDNNNSQNVCMEICINDKYKFAATQNG